MRTSREIVYDIYQREGQEAAAAFLHRLLRHTTRCCAIPDARRFLAGIELKPFRLATVGEVAAEYAEPLPPPEPSPAPVQQPCNRVERILAYMAQVGKPMTNREIHTALDLKKNDCSTTLIYLRDMGRVIVVGEIIAPTGHKARLYALPPRKEAA